MNNSLTYLVEPFLCCSKELNGWTRRDHPNPKGGTYYEQVVKNEGSVSLTFFTLSQTIVNSSEYSDSLINHFKNILFCNKSQKHSIENVETLEVGLGFRPGDPPKLIGYALDPRRLRFEGFGQINLGKHYELAQYAEASFQNIGTSCIAKRSCDGLLIYAQRQRIADGSVLPPYAFSKWTYR